MAAQDGKSDVNCAGVLGTLSRKDFSFDWTNELSDVNGVLVDSIQTVVWAIEPAGPQLTGQFVLGEVSGVFVEGVLKTKAYRLSALMTSLGGRKAEAAWAIGGVEIEAT